MSDFPRSAKTLDIRVREAFSGRIRDHGPQVPTDSAGSQQVISIKEQDEPTTTLTEPCILRTCEALALLPDNSQSTLVNEWQVTIALLVADNDDLIHGMRLVKDAFDASPV